METSIKKEIKPDKFLLLETLSIIGLVIVLRFVFQELAGLLSIIALFYFLIEGRKRKRTWSDIGFNLKSTYTDIKNNWHWIITVGIIIQVVVFTIAKYFLPGFFDHIKARIPVIGLSEIVPLLILIIIGTLVEEIIYRGFFQERISWFIRPSYAIVLLSIMFGMMHYSSGYVPIVVFDVVGVFINSIFYGIIFNRTKNIFAAWAGHLMADLSALVLIIFFL